MVKKRSVPARSNYRLVALAGPSLFFSQRVFRFLRARVKLAGYQIRLSRVQRRRIAHTPRRSYLLTYLLTNLLADVQLSATRNSGGCINRQPAWLPRYRNTLIYNLPD